MGELQNEWVNEWMNARAQSAHWREAKMRMRIPSIVIIQAFPCIFMQYMLGMKLMKMYEKSVFFLP